MLYRNANLFQGEKGFQSCDFRVENGIFTEILPASRNGSGEDLKGAFVLPGLIDLHLHGCVGEDFSDTDEKGYAKAARWLALQGVTGFAATTATCEKERLLSALRTAAAFHREQPADGAELLGIHMEGPFFSREKKGAQNPDYLQMPDPALLHRFYEAGGGFLKLLSLAPELPGAEELICEAKKLCRVAVGHTEADYEQASTAFDAGASHVTHLFNAMPPLHHRKPGVIGAAAERKTVTAELIGDGFHVHESAVRLAFSLFPGRLCLISDSLRCCGLPDGSYDFCGQTVCKQGGLARLPDGTIAGAANDLFTDLRRVIGMGVDPVQAILAATLHPAQVLGCDERVGSIECGKQADFLVCGKDLRLDSVYLHGVRVKNREKKKIK